MASSKLIGALIANWLEYISAVSDLTRSLTSSWVASLGATVQPAHSNKLVNVNAAIFGIACGL